MPSRLLAAARDAGEAVRTAAVMALGHVGGQAVREEMLLAFEDPSPKVRLAAAIGLADMREPRAFVPLLEAYEQRYDSRIETILRQLHLEEPLRSRLQDASCRWHVKALPSRHTKLTAVKTLGDLGGRRATEPLIEEWKRTVEALNQICVPEGTSADFDALLSAFVKLRDPRAVPALLVSLGQISGFYARHPVQVALGELAEIGMLEPFIQVLRKNQDAAARWEKLEGYNVSYDFVARFAEEALQWKVLGGGAPRKVRDAARAALDLYRAGRL